MTGRNISQYREIAKLLLNGLETRSFADPLLEEIGTAQADLLWPMRDIMLERENSSRELIRNLIKSINQHERLVGARLTSTGIVKDDEESYISLKKWFNSMGVSHQDECLHERKILVALSLLFFDAAKDDQALQESIREFLHKNIGRLLKVVTRYYGGVENTRHVLRKSLTPGARQTPWLTKLILENVGRE